MPSVHLVFFEYVIDHLLVTFTAQLDADFTCGKRIRRRGVFVTLVTFFLGNRFMRIVIYEFIRVRAVGIMTGSAARICHWIIHVLLCKARLISLVALQTEGRFIFLQYEFGGGSVRIMTVKASLFRFHRLMPELHLPD